MEKTWLSTRVNHSYENGRRYHGFKAEFPFPNDTEGQHHYDCQHSIWHSILDNQLFSAPILPLKKNTKVLDLATRSGAWALEFHEMYPQARITGMDPSDMQCSQTKWFIHHDLEGDWPFSARQGFHFIHAQSLAGLIGDWESLYRNAFHHLVPGGWLEIKENDLRLFSDSGDPLPGELNRWQDLMGEAAEKFGKRVNVATMQRELMERAGFVDVKEQVFKVPLGQWSENPKWQNIGRTQLYQLSRGLEGYSFRLFTHTLGWSRHEIDTFLGRVRGELQQEDLRLYSYFHVITGQKPQGSARSG